MSGSRSVTGLNTSQKQRPVGPPFPASSANNGLSVDTVTGKIVMGQNLGALGDPAKLLSNRQVPMDTFFVQFDSAQGSIRVQPDGAMRIDNALDEPYFLQQRGINIGFPVPTLRPATNNSVIAFDVMPNGSPGSVSGDTAWFDVCNTDIYQTNVVPVNAARVGAGPTRVQFGSLAFNGATDIPIETVISSTVVSEYTNQSVAFGGVLQADFRTDRFFIQHQSPGGFTGSFLFNDDAGNSSAIQFIGRSFTGLKFGFLRWECDAAAGDPYQLPNQFEVLANNGAANGMVIGCLVNGAPIKFIQEAVGAFESGRFTPARNLVVGGAAVDNGFRVQATVGTGATGAFQSSGDAVMIHTATAWGDGAAAAIGTLLNAPAAGNPTKWIPVDDNGVTRHIPAW